MVVFQHDKVVRVAEALRLRITIRGDGTIIGEPHDLEILRSMLPSRRESK